MKTFSVLGLLLVGATFVVPDAPAVAGDCMDGCLKIRRYCVRHNQGNCEKGYYRCQGACKRNHPEQDNY